MVIFVELVEVLVVQTDEILGSNSTIQLGMLPVWIGNAPNAVFNAGETHTTSEEAPMVLV